MALENLDCELDRRTYGQWDYRIVRVSGRIRVQRWQYTRWVDETRDDVRADVLESTLLQQLSLV